MKKIIGLSLSLIVVLSLGTVAFASDVTPKVVFSATSEKFSFENVKNSQNPDLFLGFKNVIPGDNMIQNIDIQIKDLAKTDTVKIYLKSETTDEVYKELLKSIDVTVKNGKEDITEKLSNQVLLGTFKADDFVHLTVTLDIPITVGNKIQSLEASTDWIFTAEILEDTSVPKTDHTNKNLWSKPQGLNLPKTGDTNNYFLWFILAIASFVGIWTIRRNKKF